MATAIVNHRVSNYATWKAGFDKDEAIRSAAGINLLAVGEKADDPGMVYIVFDVKDVAALAGMMNSPELKTRMQEAGVISAPEHVILN